MEREEWDGKWSLGPQQQQQKTKEAERWAGGSWTTQRAWVCVRHSPGGLSIGLLSSQMHPSDQIQESKTHIQWGALLGYCT